jgi:hypothetical protein
MQKRLFGSTGARVSEVGLGCWQLGGGEWGEVSDDLAMGILDAAVDSGVTAQCFVGKGQSARTRPNPSGTSIAN